MRVKWVRAGRSLFKGKAEAWENSKSSTDTAAKEADNQLYKVSMAGHECRLASGSSRSSDAVTGA